ncbi:7,8-dihydro-6-hydroxymethylpterin dimethyltransferase [uncultured archaeon]|nr:7,8-dihydro-6-hydroxymethylpterin dimethyltransferase [uncultured archaeon]
MRIGGLQKVSLIDYPGKISAIVFTQGCNYRCPFCHNKELVYPEFYEEPIPEEDVLSFLEKRKGKLDAVVITGGEPTIQKDLPQFIKKIKSMGYLIKLDTNGSNPETLAELLKKSQIDYVAMDVKAPPSKYDTLTGVETDTKKTQKSIKTIIASGIPHEFRTTVMRPLLKPADVLSIAKEIKGARLYALQKYASPKDKAGSHSSYTSFTDEELARLKDEVKNRYDVDCLIR